MERQAGILNYNAPTAQLCAFSHPILPAGSSDSQYEHNSVTTEEVHNTILQLLREGKSDVCHMAHESLSPLQAARDMGDGIHDVSFDPSESPEPAKYLLLLGVRNVVVRDEFGNSSDDIADMEILDAEVITVGEDVEMVTMGMRHPYTITFETTEGVAIDFIVEEPDKPTQAVRYWDLDIPTGVKAQLQSPADGIGLEWLRYDADGDGMFESVVQPTVEVTGNDAQDNKPPALSIATTPQASNLLVTLSAENNLSGVKAVYYSVDGVNYQRYAAPFDVDPSQHPVVYADADDNVANRSSLYEFTLTESPVPTPTPTVPPLPTETPAPAVPEPSTVLLFGIGIIGLLVFVKKASRKP